MPSLAVSISGPDNIGKTTQIRLLASALGRTCFATGGVHIYSPSWPNLSPEEQEKWWFVDSTTENLTQLIFEAYGARQLAAKNSASSLVLLDRGLLMYEAVCTATAMIKDHCDYETALKRVSAIRGSVVAGHDEDFKVILIHSYDHETSVELSLKRADREIDETYKTYQNALQDILLQQCRDNRYDAIITCGDKPIVDIQNELRLHLQTQGVSVPLFCETIQKVYGFAGMSESGKSSAADYLRIKHHVTRLKIVYLLETAAQIRNIDNINSQPDGLVAEMLIEELDRLARRQYYLKEYSLESLHGFEMTQHLMRLLGYRFVVLFCEASQDRRIARASVSAAEVLERDMVKIGRGADKIKHISDFVLNNNGHYMSLQTQLEFAYNSSGISQFIPSHSELDALDVSDEFTEVGRKMLGEVREQLGRDLKLFALVGSVGLQSAHKNWSDLDILLVITPGNLPAIRQVMHRLQSALSVKVGLTILTPAEIHLQLVEAKVVHMIRLLGLQKLRVQYLAEDFALPDFPQDEDITGSLSHLPTILHYLRRELLAQEPDVRYVYKRTILCAKIILLANKMALEDEADIVKSLHNLYPESKGIDMPKLDEIYSGIVATSEVVTMAERFLVWFEQFLMKTRALQKGSRT